MNPNRKYNWQSLDFSDTQYITGIDIGHQRMSAYDDLIKRHKAIEATRAKASAQASSKSSYTRPYTHSSYTDTITLDPSMSSQKMYDMLIRMSTNTVTGGVISPTTQTIDKAKEKPKPVKKIVDFDSVVLEKEKKQSVLEALEQLDNHDLIFEEWGFSKTLEKGRAVSMLFYGPPGTGKTLLAQAIADKLDKKLKVIGSAEIESSEPGAAERNIKAIFEGCKKDTVLLFDECDSLVYDRTNVGSILAAQVNQLLSSLEKFEGVVVFTTNRLGVLDEAFNRRLSLKLEFELPKFAERIQIWKRMFPKEAPLAKDVDWDKLADPEIAGGHIKNAVLRAARSAASVKVAKGKKKQITQAILEKALKLEIEEMVKFMEAKEQETQLPKAAGYTLRKG